MNQRLSLLRENILVSSEVMKNFCLLEINAPPISNEIKSNVDLILIIDKSGSMGGENKLLNVKKAAEHIVSMLGDKDRLGLVVFACQSAEVFPLSIINNKSYYIDKIRNLDSVEVGGSTVMSSGLNLAYNMLKSSVTKNLKRIILLTDGEVTENVEDCIKFKPLCDELGIQIRCIGVGSTWNTELLLQLDWKNQPEYIKNENVDEIPKKFESEFKGLSNTYAYDVILKFKLVNGVEIAKCNRFNPQISVVDKGYDTSNYRIGSIMADSKEYFIFQLLMPPRDKEGSYTLAQCNIEYTDISNQRLETQPLPIKLNYCGDPIKASMVNPEVQHYVKQLDAHLMVERGTSLLNTGDVTLGTTILSKAAKLTGELGNQSLQDKLTNVLNSVQKTGVLTPEQYKNIFFESRKTSLINKEE